MTNDISRIAHGGKALYGARVGILMLETRFPRIPGDMGTPEAEAAERAILDAGEARVAQHADIGAIVLECTNMTPYARALSDHLHLPVFSIYSFVTWFQAGRAPRDFGLPGSGSRVWR